MIKSFRNKALSQYYESGDARGLPQDQLNRIARRLSALEAALSPEDMNIAGFGFHKLTRDLTGYYAVKVTGNWRIIFRFRDGDVVDVDHLDYH